eukprot:2308833-Pyramimonas_sp.AAC.1
MANGCVGWKMYDTMRFRLRLSPMPACVQTDPIRFIEKTHGGEQASIHTFVYYLCTARSMRICKRRIGAQCRYCRSELLGSSYFWLATSNVT